MPVARVAPRGEATDIAVLDNIDINGTLIGRSDNSDNKGDNKGKNKGGDDDKGDKDGHGDD